MEENKKDMMDQAADMAAKAKTLLLKNWLM